MILSEFEFKKLIGEIKARQSLALQNEIHFMEKPLFQKLILDDIGRLIGELKVAREAAKVAKTEAFLELQKEFPERYDIHRSQDNEKT